MLNAESRRRPARRGASGYHACMSDIRFSSTDRYIATDDLKLAVNAAITLERPLLIMG